MARWGHHHSHALEIHCCGLGAHVGLHHPSRCANFQQAAFSNGTLCTFVLVWQRDAQPEMCVHAVDTEYVQLSIVPALLPHLLCCSGVIQIEPGRAATAAGAGAEAGARVAAGAGAEAGHSAAGAGVPAAPAAAAETPAEAAAGAKTAGAAALSERSNRRRLQQLLPRLKRFASKGTRQWLHTYRELCVSAQTRSQCCNCLMRWLCVDLCQLSWTATWHLSCIPAGITLVLADMHLLLQRRRWHCLLP